MSARLLLVMAEAALVARHGVEPVETWLYAEPEPEHDLARERALTVLAMDGELG